MRHISGYTGSGPDTPATAGFTLRHDSGREERVYLVAHEDDKGVVTFTLHQGTGDPKADPVINLPTVTPEKACSGYLDRLSGTIRHKEPCPLHPEAVA